MISIADRFLGSMLAGACGDALGAPFEFTSRIEMIVECGPKGARDFWTDGGTLGAVTDDTQLALFTASALIAARTPNGLSEIEHLHLAYLDWLSAQKQPNPVALKLPRYHTELAAEVEAQGDRCPGLTNLTALAEATTLGAFSDNRSKGCGAVTRVAPIGLLYHRDPFRAFETAVATARLTHGHPTGYLSAGAFAMLIAWSVQGKPFSSAVQDTMTYLRSHPGHEEVVTAIINAPWPTGEREKRPGWIGYGWTGEEALAIAIDAILTTRSLEEAVVVAANHDGDSDTTASIAGNLAGALYGRNAIPQRWTNLVEMMETIRRLAAQLVAIADYSSPTRQF